MSSPLRPFWIPMAGLTLDKVAYDKRGHAEQCWGLALKAGFSDDFSSELFLIQQFLSAPWSCE